MISKCKMLNTSGHFRMIFVWISCARLTDPDTLWVKCPFVAYVSNQNQKSFTVPAAAWLTHTHTLIWARSSHTQTQPSHLRSVWISKNKDDYQKPQLLDGAFKNADEPQRTLHLVPDQPGEKARDLICIEEHPTAVNTHTHTTHAAEPGVPAEERAVTGIVIIV